MVNALVDYLEGFATWQTPTSFLAGVGGHHLWAKYWRDRKEEDSVQEEG